jgi:predicted alpha/beta hydrolase
MLDPTASPPASPQRLSLTAADGVAIAALQRRHAEPDPARPVVVVAPATSVACRYYTRFAAWLFGRGVDVVTFDYRGIGLSRPARLRGLAAGWFHWGRYDLEAVLRHVLVAFPDRPLDVVGHSIGGCVVGLAPSNHRIRRVVTVGAQYAYWRDYAPAERLAMVMRWNVAMPVLAHAIGWVPAKRLGWMEDTPAGVALDWSRMRPRLEATLARHAGGGAAGAASVLAHFATLTAPMLAIRLTDDPHGTEAAVARLLAYYVASPRQLLTLAPADIGAPAIGHFAFFHDRFRDTLWPIVDAFLTDGRLAGGTPGALDRFGASPA